MATLQKDPTSGAQDNRQVVLLKSRITNNRFYALVDPSSGLKNADTVDSFDGIRHLGVAYPCLEDGLNDFAVIRTTFETMEYFPDDPGMLDELNAIIADAREKLVLRLTELRDRISNRTAHLLGTDLAEFRAHALDIVRRGYPRRNLDSMMKLNVFQSVAAAEPSKNGPEPLFYYSFRDPTLTQRVDELKAREFIAAMFQDILEAVQDERSYTSRHVFDRDVFQKFIALMFVNYATTDPVFYGTHKADYGVSSERDMSNTPLYLAIAKQLRELEARYAVSAAEEAAPEAARRELVVDLPDLVANEEALIGPLTAICTAARHIERFNVQDATDYARVIVANVAIVLEELRERGLISPTASDPTANHLPHHAREHC